MKFSKPPFKLPLEIEGENEQACVKDGNGNYIIAMSEFPKMKREEALKLHIASLNYIVSLINQQLEQDSSSHEVEAGIGH